MILAIGALLLHISTIPQALAKPTAETTLITATDSAMKSVSTDSTTNPLPAELPTSGGVCRNCDLLRLGDPASSLALPPLKGRPERLGRREWIALSVAQHSAAAFDAWTTRQAITSGQARELNPMLRPFAENTSLYAAVQVGPLAFDFIGRRMMASHHRWLRRTWWVPQAVSTALSLASSVHNLNIRN